MSEVEKAICNLNMASRLELMMEMERRIEGRTSEEKVKLEKEVARLSKNYAALLKKHEEVEASLASALEREILSADLLSSGRELEKKAIRLNEKRGNPRLMRAGKDSA